jgi:hypothetical protein
MNHDRLPTRRTPSPRPALPLMFFSDEAAAVARTARPRRGARDTLAAGGPDLAGAAHPSQH